MIKNLYTYLLLLFISLYCTAFIVLYKKLLSFEDFINFLKAYSAKRSIKLDIPINQLIFFINKLLRLLNIENCLNHSSILFILLRRIGKEPKLVIGATRDNSSFFSHTWIEIEDILVSNNSQPVDTFTPIMEIG